MSSVSTVPALLERLRVGRESPSQTLTRVLNDALALKVLEEAAVERCERTLGYSIQICVSGSGETWAVYLEDGASGDCTGSLGEALRSTADAVEKGEA